MWQDGWVNRGTEPYQTRRVLKWGQETLENGMKVQQDVYLFQIILTSN